MTALFIASLLAAAWLIFGPGAGTGRRLLRALSVRRDGHLQRRKKISLGGATKAKRAKAAQPGSALSLTILVQQLAALLRGGRSLPRVWVELWLVHGRDSPIQTQSSSQGWLMVRATGGALVHERSATAARTGFALSPGSLEVLAAARAASGIGRPIAETIRGAARQAFPGQGSRERRIWGELAACFEVAETSGCPLAEILSRFASQLEAEDDADAARRTALAGPKATVRLLGWLPVMGLGLGIALGTDPIGILLGSPFGVAALVAGMLLTLAGRVWSSKLVRAAAGSG
jgi:tight adherence protein B